MDRIRDGAWLRRRTLSCSFGTVGPGLAFQFGCGLDFHRAADDGLCQLLIFHLGHPVHPVHPVNSVTTLAEWINAPEGQCGRWSHAGKDRMNRMGRIRGGAWLRWRTLSCSFATVRSGLTFQFGCGVGFPRAADDVLCQLLIFHFGIL